MIKCVTIFTAFLLCGCFVFFDADYPIADIPDLEQTDLDQPELRSTGSACDDDAQCFDGHCQNETCCAADASCCTDDSQCGDFLCNSDLAQCYTDCSVDGGPDHSRCREASYCSGGTCTGDLPTGDCVDDEACSSNTCIRGRCCEHIGLCCATNADCGEFFDGCNTSVSACVLSTAVIPGTGQERCYRVSTDTSSDCSDVRDLVGQDGHRREEDFPARSYTVNDVSDEIVDEVTDLIWMRTPSGKLDWLAARDFCQQEGFRLPRLFELMTLVDYGSTRLFMIDEAFPLPEDPDETVATRFWTSTAVSTASRVAGDATSDVYWVVDFQTGAVRQDNALVDRLTRVRCVRPAP